MLERIDLEDSGVVDEQARALAKEFGLLGREDEIAACARNAMASECVRRALTSSRMLREVAFTAPLPGAHDHGLAEGRIDLLFVEDGEIVVVDFKTDDVAVDGVEARMDFYRTQALVYAWASRVATGLAVREVVFLFARLPEERSFRVDDKFLAEAEGVLQGPSAA
jgi:ATP-dependent exoDNAse (exonuclease V) beta subunit